MKQFMQIVAGVAIQVECIISKGFSPKKKNIVGHREEY